MLGFAKGIPLCRVKEGALDSAKKNNRQNPSKGTIGFHRDRGHSSALEEYLPQRCVPIPCVRKENSHPWV